MYISKMKLKNWRNFKSLEISFKNRTFIIGANAIGKSNLLDAFRFLRDLCSDGLQSAVKERGGISKIRCLNARKTPEIKLEIEVSEFEKEEPRWKYLLGFFQETNGKRRVLLTKEEVWEDGNPKPILCRPNMEDKKDSELLTQTHLEQLTQNAPFRQLTEMLKEINYFHLVPQLLRYPDAFGGSDLPNDPFGRGFLAKIAQTSEKTRNRYLKKISQLLGFAVPQLKELNFMRDEIGTPHLTAVYQHWRPNAGKQNETQFSDGTLRLIALLWILCENSGITLLEEPELSLHQEIVAKLPELFYFAQKNFKKKRQFVITTHSEHLLSDRSIRLSEIQILYPTKEGTECKCAIEVEQWKHMLHAGMTPAEIVLPEIRPQNIDQFCMPFLSEAR